MSVSGRRVPSSCSISSPERRAFGPPFAYGPAVRNNPIIPMVDEQSASDGRVGQPIPPVVLAAVDDPIGVIRVKDREVLVVGSGDGLVDAAAAGLIDGSELVRYSASLGDAARLRAADDADAVIITDSNRDRAHHWRSSQEVVGLTEDDDRASPDVLRRDVADERLPIFDESSVAATTVAVQEGPVRARATAYGEPFAYRPEQRPAMAVDGDPTTAWVVGDHADPVGERLELTIDEPIDHLTMSQPVGAADRRHIGTVAVSVDGGQPQHITLDDRSFGADGQRVDVTPTTGPSTVNITIESVVVPSGTPEPLAAVGFAEVDAGLGPTVEVVRLPRDSIAALRDSPATAVSYVFSRLRTRPSDRWRADPEPTMRREFEVPGDRTLTAAVTVRLDERADDETLAELLGIDGAVATSRLTGVAAAGGWAATDDDRATSWITPFGAARGARLDVAAAGPVRELTLTQPTGDFSPITGLRLTSGATIVDVAVPPAGVDGQSTVTLPEALRGPELGIEITAIEPRLTTDRRYGDPVVLPAAISELSAGARSVLPADLDTGCLDGLLAIDGAPVPVQVVAPVGELLAGNPVEATPCEPQLALQDGTHQLETTAGTGLQVDRVVLASPEAAPAPATGPTIDVTSVERTSRTATIDGCRAGCWLVLGEGFNDGWRAEVAGQDLGPPQLVDGGFNGWRLPPAEGPVEVVMNWTAQTPQTIALLVSALTVLVCIALVLLDRRSALIAEPPPAALGWSGDRIEGHRRWVAAAVWVVAAALLVGLGWALVAAIAAALLILRVGRPRLAGFLAVGLLGAIAAVVIVIVLREHPLPNAAWPVRFERLHRVGLFAAVSLLIVLFSGDDPQPRRG